MMDRPASFYFGVLWNKLYRRSIIEEYRLQLRRGAELERGLPF